MSCMIQNITTAIVHTFMYIFACYMHGCIHTHTQTLVNSNHTSCCCILYASYVCNLCVLNIYHYLKSCWYYVCTINFCTAHTYQIRCLGKLNQAVHSFARIFWISKRKWMIRLANKGYSLKGSFQQNTRNSLIE